MTGLWDFALKQLEKPCHEDIKVAPFGYLLLFKIGNLNAF